MRNAWILLLILMGCGCKEDATPTNDTAAAPATPAAEVTVASLAKELDIELTPFEEFERFRGGDDAPPVQVLFPREDVRMSDLDNFRVDVSSEFEGAGKIEFRKGRDVLFSEEFAPEEFTTLEEIPEAVRSVKPGQTVTWGYYPKKGRPVTTEFKVVKDDPRLLARIEKMEQHVAHEDSYVATAMRAQLYLNARLYYAAFMEAQRALGRETDDATQAYAVTQAALRAMKLHKTALWTDLQANFHGVRGRFAR